MSTEPLVVMRNIVRTYPGVRAVDGVDFELAAGEVVGLVGKNGAGKSTLMKILAGIQTRDAGDFLIRGEPVPDRYGPIEASRLGVGVVHQELEIVLGLSVAENVALGAGFPRRAFGSIDQRALRAKVNAILEDLQPGIDPSAPVERLSLARQRLVMIARAVYRDAQVVVLDEPSAALNDEEMGQLHAVVRRLAGRGRGVVYVTHRLQEVLDLTSRVVVMRDAREVDRRPTSEFSRQSLIEVITGHTGVAAAVTRPAPVEVGAAVLEVEGLTRTGVVEDVSLRVNAGEVLGIAGLAGAGRTELARLIFGADRADAGKVKVHGHEITLRSPRDAVRSGIAFVPEDRRTEGLMTQFGVRFNMTLATLPKHRRGRLPVPSRSSETRAVQAQIESLQIKATGQEHPVAMLSGGNQQKIVIGKWLEHHPSVLIFDEPTQGIDVEAKAAALALARDLAARGGAVLLITSDFSELVSACDRVVVLREGRVSGELAGDAISERSIVELCYRGSRDQGIAS